MPVCPETGSWPDCASLLPKTAFLMLCIVGMRFELGKSVSGKRCELDKSMANQC